jgi:hypothetical protein
MDAPFVYVVKFWVHPDGAGAIMHWLDSKHSAEVVAQPGFRWLRRVKLDEKAADNWDAYMMIYGLESREALMRYFESPAPNSMLGNESRSNITCAPTVPGERSIFASASGMTELRVLALSGSAPSPI